MLAGATYHECFGADRPSLLGYLDRPLTGEVLAGDRIRHLLDALHRAAVDDGTAVLAGSGTDVDDPITGTNGFLVMFHHQHRVAEIAKTVERVDQTVVVALVQTNRWFIQHVQGAHEPRTDLARESDSLRFSTRQGARRSTEGEIIQTHVQQESQSGIDLLGDALGDDSFALVQLESVEELRRFPNRQVAHIGDGLVVHPDRQRFRLQSSTLAGRTGLFPHVTLVLLALMITLGRFVATLQPRNHTLERGAVFTNLSVAVAVLHQNVVAEAVHDDLVLLRRQLVPRTFDVYSFILGHRLEHSCEIHRVRASPRRYGTF